MLPAGCYRFKGTDKYLFLLMVNFFNSFLQIKYPDSNWMLRKAKVFLLFSLGDM